MMSKLARAIVAVGEEAGWDVCDRRRVFGRMVKDGTFDFSVNGWTFDQLLQEAERRSLVEVDRSGPAGPALNLIRFKLT